LVLTPEEDVHGRGTLIADRPKNPREWMPMSQLPAFKPWEFPWCICVSFSKEAACDSQAFDCNLFSVARERFPRRVFSNASNAARATLKLY
jgi:hypothetical protein